MKKIIKKALALLLCGMVLFCFSMPVAGVDEDNTEVNPYLIPDEIIIFVQELPEISPGPEAEDNLEVYGLELSSIELLSGGATAVPASEGEESEVEEIALLLKLADPDDMEEALAMLNQRSDITYVEQNSIIELEDTQFDPLAENQWYLEKIGVDDGWFSGVFSGSDDITIAILDTGISPHRDLEDNIDMENAYNAYADSQDVTDLHDNGHGTIIAGIIGADLDGQGINGICEDVRILPIKISDDITHKSTTAVIMRAIDYAIEHGADVINLSYSMHTYSSKLIEKIATFDGVFVTAAGNNSAHLSASPLYENCKKNDLDNFIVVGASNQDDTKRESSNYDNIYVDLFAPGTSIYSTNNSGGYSSLSGTSFAAPQVAATCAVIMANASYLTPAEVVELVYDTADPVPALEDYCVTGARLSFYNAMNALFEIERPVYSKGDVNGDGYVTAADYTLCRRITMGTYQPTEQQSFAADINGDGNVTTVDYLSINRHVVKTYFIAI